MQARAHRFVIPGVALLAVLSLLLNGSSCGHDFDFHLLSWLEAATQFAHLHYPVWAYTPAFNAGEPRFVFYPPLSWSLGALLGLVLPWHVVPAAFTFIALTLAGFTARRLAACHAGAPAATLAAVLYMVNPYMLFTAYERTAYGELLAAAWLPLLLLQALRPRIRIVSLALPIALLWLSNAPAGVMGCYALAVLMAVRLLQPNPARARLQLALPTLAATLLGLALAAFYLVPAVAERPYIQSDMAVIAGMRIADNTLFHHMPPSPDNALHDAVLHTGSLIAVLLLGALTLCLAWLFTRKARPTFLIPVTALTALIAFLLTPASLPLWSHIPQLSYLQFTWRLNALLEAMLVLAAAPLLHELGLTRWKSAAASTLLAAACIGPAWLTDRQPCDDEDTVEARAARYHSPAGTEPTDEYTPKLADNDALKEGNPGYWLIPQDQPIDTAPQPSQEQGQEPGQEQGQVPAQEPAQAPSHLVLKLAQPETLVLNRRRFPGWQVRLNGQPLAQTDEGRDDGLITVPLPAGSDTIDLAYHQTSSQNDRRTGLELSLLALCLAAALHRRRAML